MAVASWFFLKLLSHGKVLVDVGKLVLLAFVVLHPKFAGPRDSLAASLEMLAHDSGGPMPYLAGTLAAICFVASCSPSHAIGITKLLIPLVPVVLLFGDQRSRAVIVNLVAILGKTVAFA